MSATPPAAQAPPAGHVHRLLPPPGGPADPGGPDGPGWATTLAGHLARFGAPAQRDDPGSLLAAVEAAGLTGRGGAGFPTHRKLRAVAAGGGRKVVVGNAAEGEPASSKDRVLLTRSPHLVLDGLQLAARAVGASHVHLYLRRDSGLVAALRAALAERSAAAMDRLPVELVAAPARYLAGEESALAARVSGRPAKPRFTPPRVYERGVRGRPTLVQNVETLAHAALVARYGPDWFRAVGTSEEPGTTLLTVSGAVARPTVVEVPLGTPLADVLTLAGGPTAALSAVLVGGYHGTWLPAAQVGIRLCNAALGRHGASLGAGVVVALPDHACGVVETARVMRYLAEQSAGQCGPCLNGLPLIAEAVATLAQRGRHHDVRARVERWAALVERRGACGHPDGAVRFLRSALGVFADELARHERGRCTAPAAAGLLPVPPVAVGPGSWR